MIASKGLRGAEYKQWLSSLQERNSAILAEWESGATLKAVGAKYGLGAARINQIVWKERRKLGVQPVFDGVCWRHVRRP